MHSNNLLSTDPKFVNVLVNFHLQVGSPAITKLMPLICRNMT
jgi:hypothetical protein